MFLSGDNKIQARGRLTRKPVVNISNSGNVVTTITLAVKTPFKENGKNVVVFVDYVAISNQKDKIGDRLAEYTAKGSLVTLEGYIDCYKKDKPDGSYEYIQANRITSFRCEESKEKTLQRQAEQE